LKDGLPHLVILSERSERHLRVQLRRRRRCR